MWSVIDQLEMLVYIIVIMINLIATIQKLLKEESLERQEGEFFRKYLYTVLGSGNINNGPIRIFQNSAKEDILAISSGFIRRSSQMFNLEDEHIIKIIEEYVRDVMGITYNFSRRWPIPFAYMEE